MEPDAITQEYVFNHTMLRVKDPKRSLDFYSRVLGMRLLRRLDFEEGRFSPVFPRHDPWRRVPTRSTNASATPSDASRSSN